MGLFDQIASAIDNPGLQANAGQLSGILNTVQQLSNNQGMSSTATETVLSLLGNQVRSALRSQPDSGQAQNIVDQFSGTGANPAAVNALFPPAQQQQIAQEISQRTGLNASVILSMLPILVPIVLNLLSSGGNARNPRQSSNSVLNAFLDSDRDGDVDVSDALRLAGQFLSQQR